MFAIKQLSTPQIQNAIAMYRYSIDWNVVDIAVYETDIRTVIRIIIIVNIEKHELRPFDPLYISRRVVVLFIFILLKKMAATSSGMLINTE
jgi:hypothetical protein